MSAPAHAALLRLLRAGERAWARKGRPYASLRFSAASNSEYLSLKSHADKQAYHALLVHAERKGAIAIEWDAAAGVRHQVRRIVLRDADALAELIGVVPRWRAIAAAATALSPWQDRFPNLLHLETAWRQGRKPRGFEPTDYELLVDAARTIEHCQKSDRREIPIRRLSVQLGFDSKRLESVSSALDLLLAESLDAPAREVEEVYGELGIVKHPLPALIAGNTDVYLSHDVALHVPAPYIGIAPDAVTAVRTASTCRFVLSVENLTIFHELAARVRDGVVVYTNGMPSPLWRRFYAHVVEGAPVGAKILHWGDIDGGGYRIAAVLAHVCRDHGCSLRLHLMDPSKLPRESSWRPLAPHERSQMERIAKEMEWETEVAGIETCPRAYEQEAIDIVMP